MKFTKDSKIVRLSAYGEGCYSGATAYGELYIPYEFYKNHENKLNDLTVYVAELDGKYSEVMCDIEFETIPVSDILKMESTSYDEDNDIDENVFYRFCDVLELDDEQSEIVNSFHNELLELEKYFIIEDFQIVLSKDTMINEILVPKETLVKFTKDTKNKIPEDWSWEFDWNL